MSETIPINSPTPENFDVYQQALADSQRGPQEQRYHEWLGNYVDPNAATDFARYLETRPYVDPDSPHGTEVILTPQGEATTSESYHNQVRRAHEDEALASTNYESWSLSYLAKELGQAELDKDQTRIDDLSNILLDKVHTFTGQSKTQSKEDAEEARSRLFDRVVLIKDNYKEAKVRLDASKTKSEKGLKSDSGKELNPTPIEMIADIMGYPPEWIGALRKPANLKLPQVEISKPEELFSKNPTKRERLIRKILRDSNIMAYMISRSVEQPKIALKDESDTEKIPKVAAKDVKAKTTATEPASTSTGADKVLVEV